MQHCAEKEMVMSFIGFAARWSLIYRFDVDEPVLC